MHYLCRENKGADQLQWIFVFVFAYEKRLFSRDAAHLLLCFDIVSTGLVGHARE